MPISKFRLLLQKEKEQEYSRVLKELKACRKSLQKTGERSTRRKDELIDLKKRYSLWGRVKRFVVMYLITTLVIYILYWIFV